MKLFSRQEIDFAPSENTFGLKVLREEWGDKQGNTKTYWKYGLPDGIQVLGITSDKKIVAIEEFQPGVGVNYIHLIGGNIEKDESPEYAAKRELEEETGFSSDNFELLSCVLENTGKSNRCLWFFLARDCKKIQESETGINVKLFTPRDFWKLLMEYFLKNPGEKHGGGNSLRTAVLAFFKMGLLAKL